MDNQRVNAAGSVWCRYCGAYHRPWDICPAPRNPLDNHRVLVDPQRAEEPLSGGSVDYYKLQIDKPASGAEPYTAECNDLIEALQMTYAEGNAFKAIWRHALARRGVGKKGNTMLYEAEKVEFFAQRLVEQAKG